jgi:hypothetical protein
MQGYVYDLDKERLTPLSLHLLKKRFSFSRDDDEYRQRYYRAHWQQLCAIFGLADCVLIAGFSGWSAIYLFRFDGMQLPEGGLKDTKLLIADVVGAYSGVSTT